MNAIDIHNIKEELKARNVKFEKGGILDTEWIQRQTSDELKRIISDYEKAEKKEIVAKIQKILDNAFEKYGDDVSNMLVLQYVNRNYYDVDTWDAYDDWGSVYWEDKDNTNFKPLGYNWDPEESETHNKASELQDIADDILKLLKKVVKTTDPEKVADTDACNCEWFSYTAITKDLKFVTFTINYSGDVFSKGEEYDVIDDLTKI